MKMFSVKDIMNFNFLEAPDLKSLQESVKNMKMVGGLDSDEKITDFGRIMS
jgi:HrpA-like RNA helicase